MFWLIPKNIPIVWKDEATNANGSALFFSVWFSGLFSALFFSFFRYWWLIAIPVYILTFAIIFKLYFHKRRQISRVFFVDFSEATSIVRKTLQNKGLPFDQNRNCYHLDEITIELKTYWIRRVGAFGTRVYIGPNTDSNKPMIEKLDTAFLGEV